MLMSTTEQVGNNKKGVGGFGDNPQNINPGGRPKDSLKGYTAQKLADMTPAEKDAFLKGVSKSEQWKMAEGSPHQTQEHAGELRVLVVPDEVAKKMNEE